MVVKQKRKYGVVTGDLWYIVREDNDPNREIEIKSHDMCDLEDWR